MTAVRIKGDFEFDPETLAQVDEAGIRVPRGLDNAVLVEPTRGESAGYVMVDVEEGFLGRVAYLSPARTRELAFALLDTADLVELQAGTFSLDLDPFEEVVAIQAALQFVNSL